MKSPSASTRHWADRVADDVTATGRIPLISTGISPSGEIHIGNMREVLTGDAVFRALKEQGREARFNFVADDYDPLRKVYPFLDPEVYDGLVGKPLSEIPCPCGDHASYADHFLDPFLDSLRQLGVEVEVERAHLMYGSGRMNPWIVKALENRGRLAEILHELTGRRLPDEWSPFNPTCESCGRINDAKVEGFSAADETIDYACGCGHRGTRAMAGGGKLIWRIDWPARWMMLGVTVEPFGKDHSTRGGSYDTGARIVKEVFGGEAPFPVPYEWIRLKGQGDMSSSRGNVLSIGRILEVVPPDALRYLVMRDRPAKTINFDPGIPLLQLVDQVDDASSSGRDERAVELSRAGGFEPVGVPFKHLVVVAQVARFDEAQALSILRRTGYPDAAEAGVRQRLGYAKSWLESFAPDEVKFTVQDRLPDEARELDETQRSFLAKLADGLEDGMDGDGVHGLIYEVAGSIEDAKPGHLFRGLYLALLGKVRGPRAGWFVALLGADFCRTRFREASGGSK